MWHSALGGQTLALEQAALTPFLRRLHGDVILWAGAHLPSADALSRCMVRHSIYLTRAAQDCPTVRRDESRDEENDETKNEQAAVNSASRVGTQLEALPFKSGSVDGVVLHHALEFADDPRVAMREVTRVLAPGGRVIICGFNPLSLIGVRRLWARFMSDGLRHHHLINPLRLFDWLTLLGYELDAKPQYSGYGLPFKRLQEKLDLPLLERRERYPTPPSTLPFGGVLMVSATKQAISARPQWRARTERRRLAPVAYPSVSSWRKSKN